MFTSQIEIIRKQLICRGCTFLFPDNVEIITRCSAIAERPRYSVCYSFRQKVEDWNWETVFCRIW